MEFQLAVLVGVGLLLIVIMSPGANHGRRPRYAMVGLDRRTLQRRAREQRAMARATARKMAPAKPVRALPQVTMPSAPWSGAARSLAEAHADQLVAGLVAGSPR